MRSALEAMLQGMNPVLLALLAGLFTWSLTAAGASVVFLAKGISRRMLDTALGFTAGVMIAASFWSLLDPAIELAETLGNVPWVPAVVGFLAGGAFLRLIDRLLPPTPTAQDVKVENFLQQTMTGFFGEEAEDIALNDVQEDWVALQELISDS